MRGPPIMKTIIRDVIKDSPVRNVKFKNIKKRVLINCEVKKLNNI